MYRIRFNKKGFDIPHYITTVDKRYGVVSISMFAWWDCKKEDTAETKILKLLKLKPEWHDLLEVEEV